MRRLFTKTPLAWLNLTHNKQQFVTAIIVIAFAVFLMFLQLGFRNALLDSNVEFIQRIQCDIIVVSQRRYTSFIEQTFKKQRLYQAQGIEGVKTAHPLYIGTAIWKSQDRTSERPIRVFGYSPNDLPVLLPTLPNVQEYANQLQFPSNVLADTKSRRGFGRLTEGIKTELEDRKATIIGTFELGTDFIADGNLITSDQNFLRFFVNRPSGSEGNIRKSLDEVDLGLVLIDHRYQPEVIIQQLKKRLPPDIEVLTKASFIQKDLDYWNKSTPIGFLFGLGTALGFVVGCIVVYNILYADIGDNLSQYATLKAMGYPHSYLRDVVLQESLLLGALGFFPGICISTLLYEAIANATGLMLRMSLGLAVFILILTLTMCVASGLLAIIKLRNAAPADVFGQSV